MINKNQKFCNQAFSGNAETAQKLKLGNAFKFSPLKSAPNNNNYICNNQNNCQSNDSSAASSGDYGQSENENCQTNEATKCKIEVTNSIFIAQPNEKKGMDRGLKFIQNLYKYVQEQAQLAKVGTCKNYENYCQNQYGVICHDSQQLQMRPPIPCDFMSESCDQFLDDVGYNHDEMCKIHHNFSASKQQDLSYTQCLYQAAMLTNQRNVMICKQAGDHECLWVNQGSSNDRQAQALRRLTCFEKICNKANCKCNKGIAQEEEDIVEPKWCSDLLDIEFSTEKEMNQNQLISQEIQQSSERQNLNFLTQDKDREFKNSDKQKSNGKVRKNRHGAKRFRRKGCTQDHLTNSKNECYTQNQ